MINKVQAFKWPNIFPLYTSKSREGNTVRKKNGLTSIILDSLTQPNFGNHPMQPWTQGAKARLVNLRWDAIIYRGFVIA